MLIERISKNHLKQLKDFLHSLDAESLNFYTRWRLNFDPETISNSIISSNLSNKEIGYVAIIDNKIIGYEHMNFQSVFRTDSVSEGGIVLKKFAGKGVGSLLKKQCIETAKNLKLNKFTATVYDDNPISLRYTKKGGYCIAGIFLNEEISNNKIRNAVYVEMPLAMKKSQEDYVAKLKYYSNFVSNFHVKHTSSQNHLILFDKDDFLEFNDKNGFPEHLFRNIFLEKIRQLNTNKLSEIICVENLTHEITVYGFVEFFQEIEKKHVGRLHIIQVNNSVEDTSNLINSLLQKISSNIQKIWVTIPESDTTLLNALYSNNFFVESIAFSEYVVDSKPTNSLCLAFHRNEIFTADMVVNSVNNIIKSNT